MAIQLKRDSAADWTSNNPTLESGRVGIETDTKRFKIGDGSTAWTSLEYENSGEHGAEDTVASATTTAIGATTSENVSITGTTTITGFGTAAAGTKRWGRFTGALTLTHNGTSLILPGAANITTAAGDRFVAVSLGSGNWLVHSYTKASGEAVVGGSGGALALRTGFRFFDDFLDDAVPDTPWTVYTSGTNSAVIAASTPATNRPGILALKPGVSGSGNGAAAYLGRSSFAFGGGAVTWEASINIGSALSDATDEYDIIMGATNERASISQANGVYFVYDRNVSVNWQCGVAQANSRTLTPTSVAVAANTWVRLKFVVNAAATEVLFYIDDVLVHTESGANIPDSSANATAAALFTMVRSAGTTYREANIDYVDVQQQFTSAR